MYTRNLFIYLLDWSAKGERCEQDPSRCRHDSRDGGFAQVVSCTRLWSDMMAFNLWNDFNGHQSLFSKSSITVTSYWNLKGFQLRHGMLLKASRTTCIIPMDIMAWLLLNMNFQTSMETAVWCQSIPLSNFVLTMLWSH